MSTLPDAAAAELDVAGAAGRRRARRLAAVELGDQLWRHDARGALGEHARLRHAGGRDVADRVDAGVARLQRGRVDGHVAVLGHAAGDAPRRGRGASARRGRGRTAARLPSSSTATPRAASTDAMRRPAMNAMPRSANSVDQRGGGLGRRRHRRAERDDERDLAARRARRARSAASWSSSAHSLGAGGHLNGAPHTPITAWPSRERRDRSRPAARRRPRSRTRCRPRRGRAWRRSRSRRRARSTSTSASCTPASVVTRRASGSIAVIVSCRKRTPGLAMSR